MSGFREVRDMPTAELAQEPPVPAAGAALAALVDSELPAETPAAPEVVWASGAPSGVAELDMPAGWERCPGAEVLALPVAQLRDLPLHWALDWTGPDGSPVVWSSAGTVASAGQAAGIAVFGPLPVDAMALAAEHGRALPEDVITWIARRREKGTGWSLGKVEACGFVGPGAFHEAAVNVTRQLGPRGWSVGRVAGALGFQFRMAWTGPEREQRKAVSL